MEQVRAMESPAHCTTAGGELDDNSGDLIDFSTEDLEDNSGDLIDFSTEDLENNSGDLIDFFTEVSTCLVMPACMESPPTLPLLPMSTSVCSPLSPDSPSAHPQPTTCAVGAPRVCQLPSASGLEDPSSPPPASESRTPPQPSDPAASPRLSAPSSPSSPIGPPAPPGSLVFPAPPWSVVGPSSPQDSVPTAAPRHSVPPALWTSFLPLAQPPSSVAPAPPRTFGSPPTPRSPEPRAPPWPSGSSVSPWIFGSPSPPRAPPPAPPPAAPPPLFSTMAPPSVGSTVGRHDGCGLGLAWLLLLRVPPEFSLAPPSVVTTLDFVYCPPPGRPSATRASSHNDFIIFTPFHAARSRLPGGGSNQNKKLEITKRQKYSNEMRLYAMNFKRATGRMDGNWINKSMVNKAGLIDGVEKRLMNKPTKGAIDPTHHRLIIALITSSAACRCGTVGRKWLSSCRHLHQLSQILSVLFNSHNATEGIVALP
ncbi:Titin [Labeo rohita]|uniref:Titin n=1 Tax=Labeo rohita TaxID=84645 RepID=A0ABQ8L0N7_LABRO|nr:Titin [Labeo rohita]